jgi:cytochrome c
VKLASGSHSDLTALGEKLWHDRSLGSSGIACSTCHTGGYGQMKDSFDAPYPHYVEMPAQRAGVKQVSAAEMVNFCMIVPMQDDPLPWKSRELAALAAYVEKLQAGFEPGRSRPLANPCNPCGMKANPCGARRNPCNPFSAKSGG